MGIIFHYSAQTGLESTDESMGFGYTIGQVLISDFDNWSYDEQYTFCEKIEKPIRKLAHMCEYAVLGILVYLSFKDSNRSWFYIAWIICILYASSDEFHQLFVKGRSGEIRDVLIDSIGAFLGIVITYRLKKLITKK